MRAVVPQREGWSKIQSYNQKHRLLRTAIPKMNEWMRMQMFNVQSKNRQEVSLVYCTNQTKRLMEKKKKKTIEQSIIRKGRTVVSCNNKIISDRK